MVKTKVGDFLHLGAWLMWKGYVGTSCSIGNVLYFGRDLGYIGRFVKTQWMVRWGFCVSAF